MKDLAAGGSVGVGDHGPLVLELKRLVNHLMTRPGEKRLVPETPVMTKLDTELVGDALESLGQPRSERVDSTVLKALLEGVKARSSDQLAKSGKPPSPSWVR